ncbi:DUF4158 domain-containing protein [Streptomyces sp. NPDC002285]
MASVERTAYPRFKRIISERELAQFFTPDEVEIVWAAKRTRGRPESLLTLLVLLKSCARLGYFPGLDEVPVVVIAHVRAAAGSPEDAVPGAEERTAKRYRSWIREYLAWCTTRCEPVGSLLPRWRRRRRSAPRWWT